jgi:hypothetical protein
MRLCAGNPTATLVTTVKWEISSHPNNYVVNGIISTRRIFAKTTQLLHIMYIPRYLSKYTYILQAIWVHIFIIYLNNSLI